MSLKKQLRIEVARLKVVDALLVAIENYEVFNSIIAERNRAHEKLVEILSLSNMQAQALLALKMPPEKIEKEQILAERERLACNIKQIKRNLNDHITLIRPPSVNRQSDARTILIRFFLQRLSQPVSLL
jgi:DNA gyrase/topoisomerase IV subunit A